MERKGSQAAYPFPYVYITSAEQGLGFPHLPVPCGGKEAKLPRATLEQCSQRQKERSPAVGIEPTTARLTAACSTTELDRNLGLKIAKRRQQIMSKFFKRQEGGSARSACRCTLSRASFCV